jgi:AcrR family transcriptional regulator
MAKKERKRRKEARPSEILEAGFYEFAEKGFDGTRLDKVAARAGVAKGTIYLYFSSKEELFEAAVRSRIIPVVGYLESLVDMSQEPTKQLLKMMFEMMYQKLSDPDVRTIIKIIIAEGDRFPELTEFYYNEFISKIVTILEKIIDRGVQRGELQISPATKLPQVLIAPAIMAAIWQITFSPYKAISLNQFLEAHIDLMMNGIGK